MNLISKTYYLCEKSKYESIVLRKYIIISLELKLSKGSKNKITFERFLSFYS